MEAMLATRSVLIVEDDEVIRDMLKKQLADDHGFIVFTAATLEAADKVIDAENSSVDAVILDRGLDGDGCDYCMKLRRHGRNMPVIMLTGMDSEEDIIRGLESGAHDYIAKPFRINELLARLRAQLREFDSSEDATFSIGPYIFNPSKKLLQDSVTDRRILLTKKEAAILKYLYRSNANPVDREKLLHDVWGYNDGTTSHTVETHIYRLRKKLEPDPRRPALLVTERNGYRLNSLVEFDTSQVSYSNVGRTGHHRRTG
jgi:DNA-binding response OmpR family regulator